LKFNERTTDPAVHPATTTTAIIQLHCFGESIFFQSVFLRSFESSWRCDMCCECSERWLPLSPPSLLLLMLWRRKPCKSKLKLRLVLLSCGGIFSSGIFKVRVSGSITLLFSFSPPHLQPKRRTPKWYCRQLSSNRARCENAQLFWNFFFLFSFFWCIEREP
jgi:hypothetical protein